MASVQIGPTQQWDDTHGDQQDAKFDGGSSPTTKLNGHRYIEYGTNALRTSQSTTTGVNQYKDSRTQTQNKDKTNTR